MRDNNKLGVVITPKVRTSEVKSLTQSLVQGFHRNFPNQDLTVLVYAPDKKLILTAQYDTQFISNPVIGAALGAIASKWFGGHK